ncbi:chloride channel protein [Streptococcus suis]
MRLASYWFKLVTTICLVSLLTGVGGILLHHLQDLVGELLYGREKPFTPAYFSHLSSQKIVILVTVTGLLSGLVWYLLQNQNHRIHTIKAQLAAKNVKERPGMLSHLIHIAWQIISVAAGSPIGKEAAPRELGALLAGRLSDREHFSLSDRRLMIACGAAAGLSAVYQVPVASVFFAFETMGISLSIKNFLLASLSMGLAAGVAGLSISSAPLYQISAMELSWGNLELAVCLALVIAPLASLFRNLTAKAQARKAKDKRLLWQLPLAFSLLAISATIFPELLGNGSAFIESLFLGMDFQKVVILLLLKAALVLLVLRAGAYGGTLTPSVAIGASLGYVLATALTVIWPSLSMDPAMVLGSAIFLAMTMKAPLTATALVISFTGQPLPAYLPLLLAVGTAYLSHHYLFTFNRK